MSAYSSARFSLALESRWTADHANRWYAELPWLCGVNYLPSTAVNFIDMWQAQTFDPETIARELGWAAGIGFNTLRTNLPFQVWAGDRDGLIARIDAFLAIADGLGLKTMLCLMDDCGFSGEEGHTGLQPAPVPGVHNSRAVAMPGVNMVIKRHRWDEIVAYIGDVVSAFRTDTRVLVWDLYNEPGNHMIVRADRSGIDGQTLEPSSHDLMIEAFIGARAAKPLQPLTVGAWHIPMPWDKTDGPLYGHPIDQAALALSDVTSFHAYCPAETLIAAIALLKETGRPLLCTEWMARSAQSRIRDQLPILKGERIGAWQWGLVNGKTQTHLPWPQLPIRQADAEVWFHDLLYQDGSFYDPREAELIASIVGKARKGM